MISGFIFIIFAPTITCNLIKQTDALLLSIYPVQRLLKEAWNREPAVWDDFHTPFHTLCPEWLEIWGGTLSSSLLTDFIAVSLHSLLLFLLCFSPFFFSFPLTARAAKNEMTSCRGEVRLNAYPQGPAGEPGTNGRKGICSTGGWGSYQRGKSYFWKGHWWHRWSF